MNRLRQIFAFLFVALLFLSSFEARAESLTPSATIARFHAELLDVMKHAEKLGYTGRKARMDNIVPATLDLKFMSEKSIGHRWQALDETQQTQLHTALRELAISRYASRFNGYSGESFQLLGETAEANGLVLVRSQITKSDGEIVGMHYRMHQVNGHWLVIDVLLNGNVSEIAMRRSEFSSVLKQEGVSALLTSIQKNIAEIENPTDKTKNKTS